MDDGVETSREMERHKIKQVGRLIPYLPTLGALNYTPVVCS